MVLRFGVITLIPEIMESLRYGVTGRALERELASLDCWNPRDWAELPYRQVDDKPYGGGPGMLMMYEPLHASIAYAKGCLPNCKTVYLSPQGKTQDQAALNSLVKTAQPLLFVAGRYEGIDERVITQDIDEEWSLGDFVLSGGELAAMVYIDAMIRLLPGSLGHNCSAAQDSHMQGVLDCPHYTRPALVDGLEVPAVLLGGHHKEIEQWRRKQALGNTWKKRPDLLAKLVLSESDQSMLDEFIREQG